MKRLKSVHIFTIVFFDFFRNFVKNLKHKYSRIIRTKRRSPDNRKIRIIEVRLYTVSTSKKRALNDLLIGRAVCNCGFELSSEYILTRAFFPVNHFGYHEINHVTLPATPTPLSSTRKVTSQRKFISHANSIFAV